MKLLTSLTEWLTGFKQVSLKRKLQGESSTETSTTIPADKEQLNQLDITEAQMTALQNTLIQQFLSCLAESHITDAMAKWQKLYENFRIGLQLGFQTFHETLNESGESASVSDASQELDSDNWEKLSVQLLSRFDHDCAHEIQQAFNAPETFITQSMIMDWLSTTHQQSHAVGTPLIKQMLPLAQQNIVQHVTSLNTHLQMSASLEKLMANPGAIAVSFEMYLWARYIKVKHIGGYAGKLQSLLQITPRIAPRVPVVQRLADLRVIDTSLLANTADKNANSHLKQLNEWAQTQTKSRLSMWEDIREGHAEKNPPKE